jgi:hypothetical protein
MENDKIKKTVENSNDIYERARAKTANMLGWGEWYSKQKIKEIDNQKEAKKISLASTIIIEVIMIVTLCIIVWLAFHYLWM